ncbi:HAMP domain-containing protein [Nonomuraea sp. K274]|uniref:histidine kinase n=1 Tax=Nonomuraea cypriaca TaxID=1187855 RepID=A0A931F4R7_9ACTN|nr:HAMP domain-containing protein [Nonomuraea cypriaca]MBF8191391.1 HAMP domain-containing protein [Nonomuraea cypriaca]
MIVSLLALVVLAPLGATAGLAVRHIAAEHLYAQAEDVAGQWIAAARTAPSAAFPDPLPASGDVSLIQIIDDHGTVLATSAAARGRAPLTSLRPTPDDPVKHVSDGRYMVVAVLSGSTPVVLAARDIPGVLRGHRLEYLLAGLVLALAAGAGTGTWAVVGRALRPVEAMRAQLAQITLDNLSRRLPVPSGHGELAELAHTANGALARLDEEVLRQRRRLAALEARVPQPAAGGEPRHSHREPAAGQCREPARPAAEAAELARNSKHKASKARTATAAVP